MSSRLKGWIVVLLLGGAAAYALAEEMTLTTYYPSPRGVYKELRTSGNVQIGSVEVPIDPVPRLHIIGDTDPASTTPVLRIDDKNGWNPTLQQDATPFLIDADGNVGIGTVPPATGAAKLEVAGTVDVTTGYCIAGVCKQSFSEMGFANFQVFDVVGPTPWSVPAGVTKIMVKVWGGGGPGGWARQCDDGAGGGGGGGYAEGIFSVAPGTPHTVTVGAGGDVASGTGPTSGGTSRFDNLISATGGEPGTNGNWGFPNTIGGVGGIGNSPLIIAAGIQGQPGQKVVATGGGELARGGNGGGGFMGGAGGLGGRVNADFSEMLHAQAGTAPGGGGGGAGGGGASVDNPCGLYTAGNGAAGRVIVLW